MLGQITVDWTCWHSNMRRRIHQIETPYAYLSEEIEMDQFFTWGSLASLGGATAATVVVTNTIAQVLGFFRRWMPLLIAQLICIGAAAQQGLVGSDYVLAALNGCLVYLSAAGTNNGVLAVQRDGANGGGGATSRDGVTSDSARAEIAAKDGRPAFFADWFRAP